MVGPYGIEQVDVGRALQMYGAGREMRAAEMEAERKRKADERAAEVQGRLAAVYARAFQPKGGGPASTSGLVATPEQEAESARMEAMFPETRGMTPPDAFQNPLMRPEVRQQLVGEIATIDPKQVPELFDMFSKLDDAQLKRAQDVYKMGGAVALEIRNTPPAQRAALIQKRIEQFGPMIPQFAEILQRTDPNDNAAWEALFNQARDIEKVAAAGLPETRVLPEGATIYEQAPTSPFRSFGAAPQIPPEAIADLRANPGTAAQFDQIFGPGAAQSVLGGRQTMSAGGNTMTQSQYRAVQQSMGTSAAARWLAANNIRVVAD